MITNNWRQQTVHKFTNHTNRRRTVSAKLTNTNCGNYLLRYSQQLQCPEKQRFCKSQKLNNIHNTARSQPIGNVRVNVTANAGILNVKTETDVSQTDNRTYWQTDKGCILTHVIQGRSSFSFSCRETVNTQYSSSIQRRWQHVFCLPSISVRRQLANVSYHER